MSNFIQVGDAVVHLNIPETLTHKAVKVLCPDCKKESLHLIFCYEWYGPERTCLRCGRKWSDGHWMPLAFYRYARRDNIRSAKRHWRQVSAVKKEGDHE
jgi:ribosomal protein L37AE/L43A